MLDSLPIQPIVLANISGDDLATAETYERVFSTARDEFHRRKTVSTTEAATLRIAHQPPTASRATYRSLLGVSYDIKRVDVSGVLVQTDTSAVNIQLTRSPGITEAEFDKSIVRAIGALLACRTAMYNLET